LIFQHSEIKFIKIYYANAFILQYAVTNTFHQFCEKPVHITIKDYLS